MDETGLTVRTASLEDIESLVRLMRLGSLQPASAKPPDVSPYRAALREITDDVHNSILVVDNGDVVIAFCQVFAIRHFQGRGGLCAEIESFHVDPDFRRKGIGAHLIGEAIAMARDWGCYRIQVTSNKNRPEAHHFYKNAGFVPSHEGFKLYLSDPQAAAD